MVHFKPDVWFLSALGLVLTINLFFAQIYWNDKTSTAVSIVESMYLGQSLVAKNVPCIQGGTAGTKTDWAEEPPVFHGLSLVIKALGFNDLYVKILPLLSLLLFLFGSLLLLEHLYAPARDQRLFSGLLVMCTPFVYIHASRFIPDVLMVGFSRETIERND